MSDLEIEKNFSKAREPIEKCGLRNSKHNVFPVPMKF